MNIFKYSLPPIFTDTIITVPKHSYPLTAQLNGNKLAVWFAQPDTALLELEDAVIDLVQFRVSVISTGKNVVEEGVYLSTIQIPPLVYHVFWEAV